MFFIVSVYYSNVLRQAIYVKPSYRPRGLLSVVQRLRVLTHIQGRGWDSHRRNSLFRSLMVAVSNLALVNSNVLYYLFLCFELCC
jgi:hypothetical protein